MTRGEDAVSDRSPRQPQHEPPRPLLVRLRLAAAALAWERLWPALWPAVAVLGVFAVVALFDLLPLLPGWLHAASLVLFVAALGAGLVLAWRRFDLPGTAAARRRLEQASGLAHRPLAALSDRIAGGAGQDPAAAALWEAHLRRMQEATRRLRIGVPAAGLVAHDPWGLRAAIGLALFLAVFAAGDQWRQRVARALSPSVSLRAAPATPPSLDIWVTPPDYTGLPPQFLQRDHQADTVSVPVGSTVLAQVSGGSAVPHLSIVGAPAADKPPADKASADKTGASAAPAASDFARVDAHDFKATATVTAGRRIAVEQGGSTLGSWPIEVVPDQPPQIAFAQPPQRTQRAALRFDYQATDDYGVETVRATIRLQDRRDAEPLTLDLPLPGQHLKDAKGTSFQDLTPHPWAGLPVEIRLSATDAIGQTGESEPVRMVLPERTFTHPIAKAIIEERKQLVRDPSQRQEVGEILSDLSARPGRYNDDVVVFMALRTAYARLVLGGDDPAAIPAVQQLLWDTALRIEDGRTPLAQREMRELQQKLQDALARNAPDAEIERLIDELKQAIDRYLQAMAEQMQKMDPSQLENMPPADPSQMISRDDLQKMLDRARDLARTGAKDAARDMLSQLQNMLENLRAARPGQMQQGGDSQARQMMRNMRDLMQRQQQLLDQSFRQSRQGQQGQQGQRGRQGQQGGQQDQQGQQGQKGGDQAGDMAGNAGRQEALRRALGEMMRQLGEGAGEIPQPLGRAERAMRDAAEALRNGQPGQAVGPQTDALDQLQQAMRSMAEQMQQQMGNGEGDPTGQPDMSPPRQRVDRDPFGRPLPNNGTGYDNSDVNIPGQGEMQKSREILDELRRRAGERSRPEIERDYIDRLLKRF
ncbi:MAG TPA: TIGR02302 family protein [Stellaceae bacterium]